jgi:hypothetical protein
MERISLVDRSSSCSTQDSNLYSLLSNDITTCELIPISDPCQDSGTARQATESNPILAHQYPWWAVTLIPFPDPKCLLSPPRLGIWGFTCY